MKKVFACLLLLVSVSPAFAADKVPVWKIISDKSAINFEGTQMGAVFKGDFKKFDGVINFDPQNLKDSKADIFIHMDSVDATSKDRTDYLPTEPWFNTAKYPDAHFVTTSIEKTDQPNQYVAKAKLTIREFTLPVTLPFILTIEDKQANIQGETTISRIDFGVGQGDWKDTSTVSANVKINVKIIAQVQ